MNGLSLEDREAVDELDALRAAVRFWRLVALASFVSLLLVTVMAVAFDVARDREPVTFIDDAGRTCTAVGDGPPACDWPPASLRLQDWWQDRLDELQEQQP